jgi:hypothetical protein
LAAVTEFTQTESGILVPKEKPARKRQKAERKGIEFTDEERQREAAGLLQKLMHLCYYNRNEDGPLGTEVYSKRTELVALVADQLVPDVSLEQYT